MVRVIEPKRKTLNLTKNSIEPYRKARAKFLASNRWTCSKLPNQHELFIDMSYRFWSPNQYHLLWKKLHQWFRTTLATATTRAAAAAIDDLTTDDLSSSPETRASSTYTRINTYAVEIECKPDYHICWKTCWSECALFYLQTNQHTVVCWSKVFVKLVLES